MQGTQGWQTRVAVHGVPTQPLESVMVALIVQVLEMPPQDSGMEIEPFWAVTVTVPLLHPVRATLYGAVPPLIAKVKLVDAPKHRVAVAGVKLQLGVGLTTKVAVQVFVQPNASVTVKV